MTTRHLFNALTMSTALSLCSLVNAQSDAGLIGKRTLHILGMIETATDLDIDNGNGFGGGVNLPLHKNWDLGLDASYLQYSDFDFKDRRLGATFRGHALAGEGLRLFGDLLLAYSSQSSVVGGIRYENDDGQWGLGAGAEVPLGAATSFFGRIAHWKWLDSDNGKSWTYTIGLNRWFTPKLNLGADITWLDDETVTYRLACHVRF